MRRIFKSKSLAIGLAMFSMFFGAGNIIFSLAVGQYAGDKNFFAIAGLVLTAAVLPIAGVISMVFFDGNYKEFFGRLGKVPGFILALTTISLLGPLGSTPRCIALAYTTMKGSLGSVSLISFSAVCCVLIFLFTVRKNQILTFLGWVLTPVLIGSLLMIIGIGLFSNPNMAVNPETNLNVFVHGLKEGYNTMDLLAAFFFSSTIINLLRLRNQGCHVRTTMKGSVIAAVLLGFIYIGFSYVAAFHGNSFIGQGKDELLSAITMRLAGPYAGVLLSIAVESACLTTAIALMAAFTDFIQSEVMKSKVRYEFVLIGSLLLTFFISTFEFTGISKFLGPVLQVCYPGLILLTFLNIAFRLKEFKPIKTPIFLAFGVSTVMLLCG